MECRKLLMLPIECVVRGYLSGLGLEELPGERRGLRDRASRGSPRVGAASGADLHADDEGSRGPRRAADPGAGGRLIGVERLRRAGADLDRALHTAAEAAAREGDHHRRHEVRARAGRRRHDRARRRGFHTGLLALLAGATSTSPARRSPRSTSSSCATTQSRSAGTRLRPGPSSPTTSSPARAPATSRRSSRSRGLSFDEYAAEPTPRCWYEGDRARPAEARDPRSSGQSRRGLAPASRVQGRRSASRAPARPRGRRIRTPTRLAPRSSACAPSCSRTR